VDHQTPAFPDRPEGEARLNAEAAVQNGPWSSIVLRPAAIYGPGRGVHVRIRNGVFRLAGAGNNYVSRIHVEDLAAHVEAALFSEVSGAWPVADRESCTSREIAEYCARLLGVPGPGSADRSSLHRTLRANRRVDGSGIREALGLELRYPTWREGVPASIQAERGES
jgi:nucleoside-diphosphate-sugar epimerase